MEVPDEADPHSAHAPLQPRRKTAAGYGGAAGIERVMSGEDVEHQRVVGDGPGQRPDMVEGEGQRKNAPPRDQPISRLEPDDPASAGRVAHAAAGVAAKSHREQPGGDAGAGAG